MKTAKQLLIEGLKAMGADGLCNCEGDPFCGCGLDDLAPCEASCGGGISLDGCRPAKRDGKYNFYPMVEFIAEVEANRALIERTAKNFLALEPGLSWEGGIDAAMKAAVAEVERLRSQSVEQVFRRKNEEIATKDTRIAELEALNELNHKNMRSWLNTISDKEFLDKLQSEIGHKDARIKELEAENQQLIAFCKDYLSANERRLKDLIIRDGQIERLEAAFLEARHDWACSKFDDIRTRDECDQHAREALERIKEGQKG